MGKIVRWNKVGTWTTDLDLDGTEPYFNLAQRVAASPDEVVKLSIEFRSKGYHDSGSGIGYPPEGEDIRTLEKAYLVGSRGEVELPRHLAQGLFNQYEKQIDQVELSETVQMESFTDWIKRKKD